MLDLRLVRPFNVDLGFPLQGETVRPPARTPRPDEVQPGDDRILQALSHGLPLVPEPYAALADSLKRREDDILARIAALLEAGILGRLGIIVRHRTLGWTSNAMVVWDVPAAQVEVAGPLLSAQPGVTLCYERRPAGRDWPYRLYAMFHARSRDAALADLARAETVADLGGTPRQILFSRRCFRQRGALISTEAA